MKKFINDPYDVADEMLEGFVQVHSDIVRKIDGVRALVRVDAPTSGKVGLVSGGGSGHKPAFIGYLGEGLLDAVAVGDIFTSPPPNACLEAARCANGGRGVLFLLGNYAGDVMNFGMAADLAKAQGIEVARFDQCKLIKCNDAAGQEDLAKRSTLTSGLAPEGVQSFGIDQAMRAE